MGCACCMPVVLEVEWWCGLDECSIFSWKCKKCCRIMTGKYMALFRWSRGSTLSIFYAVETCLTWWWRWLSGSWRCWHSLCDVRPLWRASFAYLSCTVIFLHIFDGLKFRYDILPQPCATPLFDMVCYYKWNLYFSYFLLSESLNILKPPVSC